jgi:hypothetical protein
LRRPRISVDDFAVVWDSLHREGFGTDIALMVSDVSVLKDHFLAKTTSDICRDDRIYDYEHPFATQTSHIHHVPDEQHCESLLTAHRSLRR